MSLLELLHRRECKPFSLSGANTLSPAQMCVLPGFAGNRAQEKLLRPEFHSDFRGSQALREPDLEVEIVGPKQNYRLLESCTPETD